MKRENNHVSWFTLRFMNKRQAVTASSPYNDKQVRDRAIQWNLDSEVGGFFNSKMMSYI